MDEEPLVTKKVSRGKSEWVFLDQQAAKSSVEGGGERAESTGKHTADSKGYALDGLASSMDAAAASEQDMVGTLRWPSGLSWAALPETAFQGLLSRPESLLAASMSGWGTWLAAVHGSKCQPWMPGSPRKLPEGVQPVHPSLLDGASFPLSATRGLLKQHWPPSLPKNAAPAGGRSEDRADEGELVLLVAGASRRAEQRLVEETSYFGSLILPALVAWQLVAGRAAGSAAGGGRVDEGPSGPKRVSRRLRLVLLGPEVSDREVGKEWREGGATGGARATARRHGRRGRRRGKGAGSGAPEEKSKADASSADTTRPPPHWRPTPGWQAASRWVETTAGRTSSGSEPDEPSVVHMAIKGTPEEFFGSRGAGEGGTGAGKLGRGARKAVGGEAAKVRAALGAWDAARGRGLAAVVVFNGGFGNTNGELTASWAASLRALLGENVPCVFTCANAVDRAGEAAVMTRLGARVSAQLERNPFHGCSTFVPEVGSGGPGGSSGAGADPLEGLQTSCANEVTYGVRGLAEGASAAAVADSEVVRAARSAHDRLRVELLKSEGRVGSTGK